MIDPSPELPDDTLIESVELPPKIKHTLVTAGLEPVGDIRETPDSEILQIQISGTILSLFCAQPWDCRPPLECAATSFRSRQRAKIEVAATPFRHPTMRWTSSESFNARCKAAVSSALRHSGLRWRAHRTQRQQRYRLPW